MKALTSDQEEVIRKRKAGIKNLRMLLENMDRLLDEVKYEVMDENGEKANPWLIADGDLSKADSQWGGYKKELVSWVKDL